MKSNRKVTCYLSAVCAALGILVGIHGCGAEPASTPSSDMPTVPVAETAAEPTFPAEFVAMAHGLAPIRVYGWQELPDAAAVAAEWWPVVDCRGPGEYSGPPRPNPWVDDDPSEPEAQLVLKVTGGWLVVLENFRGDLGDVVGSPVGSVGEDSATLYEVNEGWLVQWSHEGRWYGVFGRGVAREVVVDAALLMQPVRG